MDENPKLSEVIPNGMGLFTTESQAQEDETTKMPTGNDADEENTNQSPEESTNNLENPAIDQADDERDYEPHVEDPVSEREYYSDDEKLNYVDNSTGNNRPIPPPVVTEPSPRNRTDTQSPKSPRRQTFKPAQVDSSAVDPIVQQLLNGEKVTESDPGVLAATVVELENNRNLLMSSGKIRESLAQQKALDRAKQLQLQAAKNQYQKAYLEEIQRKKVQAQAELEKFEQEVAQSEADWSEKARLSQEAMEQRHEQELAAYDEEWQGEQKARQFNRMSAKLRAMRHQQTLLLNAKRFDEAEQVMKLADQQEQAETRENSQAMLQQFLAGRKAVEARHASETNVLNATIQGRKAELAAIYERQKSVYERRLQVLENEEKQAQDPEHVWILQHRNDGDMVAAQRQVSKTVSRSTMKTTANYGCLPLPPLQIPQSARVTKNRR